MKVNSISSNFQVIEQRVTNIVEIKHELSTLCKIKEHQLDL